MKRNMVIVAAIFMLSGCAGVQGGETVSSQNSVPQRVEIATQTPDASSAITQESSQAQSEISSQTLEELLKTPQPTHTPASSIPQAAVQPTQQPTPQPTVQPTQAPVEQAASVDKGALSFSLSESSGQWCAIDSSSSAYWAVLNNINAMRAQQNLAPLTMEANLSAAASERCKSFVVGGPFDHSGMTTESEICAAGPIASAADVCENWKNSPQHYANIMEPSFTKMGVACWFCSVDGNQYTYWCVTFER